MIRFLRALALTLLLTGLAACSDTGQRRDRELSAALEALDQAIVDRPAREEMKRDRLKSLKQAYRTARTWQDRSALSRDIIDEYLPYQFDSTLAWISSYRSLSERSGRPEGVAWADIKLGEVMAAAGYHMESYHALVEVRNPLYLSDGLKRDYYYALWRLADNITENSLGSGRLNLGTAAQYADTLLTLYPDHSYTWGSMYLQRLAAQGRFQDAREANARFRATMDKDSHDYAKSAWFESVICDSLGLDREQLLWEIASATVDFRNVVRDYASLNLVCRDVRDIDLDRSFRYVRQAMEDAVFYNAKLRPWQLSHNITQIQDAWSARELRNKRRTNAFVIGLSVLAILLLLVLRGLTRSNRQLSRANAEVKDLADRLTQANADIQRSNAGLSESNVLKEHYIGLFLSQLSDNIDKVKSLESNVIRQLRYGKSEQLLKEMLSSTAVEEETEAFYDTFDSTFLDLFPDFVRQFNDLLEEPIVLKKDEKLNTELRIFALVRLGIEDSNVIASLLKYSVRTIYNYKVKIRNSARVPREEFDEMVRKIG